MKKTKLKRLHTTPFIHSNSCSNLASQGSLTILTNLLSIWYCSVILIYRWIDKQLVHTCIVELNLQFSMAKNEEKKNCFEISHVAVSPLNTIWTGLPLIVRWFRCWNLILNVNRQQQRLFIHRSVYLSIFGFFLFFFSKSWLSCVQS